MFCTRNIAFNAPASCYLRVSSDFFHLYRMHGQAVWAHQPKDNDNLYNHRRHRQLADRPRRMGGDFRKGVRLIGPSRTALTSTIEPVCTVLLGVLTQGEKLTLNQVIGDSPVVTALLLLQRGDRRPVTGRAEDSPMES